jgi:hypothetical protein
MDDGISGLARFEPALSQLTAGFSLLTNSGVPRLTHNISDEPS